MSHLGAQGALSCRNQAVGAPGDTDYLVTNSSPRQKIDLPPRKRKQLFNHLQPSHLYITKMRLSTNQEEVIKEATSSSIKVMEEATGASPHRNQQVHCQDDSRMDQIEDDRQTEEPRHTVIIRSLAWSQDDYDMGERRVPRIDTSSSSDDSPELLLKSFCSFHSKQVDDATTPSINSGNDSIRRIHWEERIPVDTDLRSIVFGVEQGRGHR